MFYYSLFYFAKCIYKYYFYAGISNLCALAKRIMGALSKLCVKRG